MPGLLTTSNLTDEALDSILREALEVVPTLGVQHTTSLPLHGRHIALAFFEPSTRTRLSFETAAHRLGVSTVLFQQSGSSVEKGESLEETIATIEAMKFDAIVLRHGTDGIVRYLSERISTPIVNAGEGITAHPTQALLDVSTLLEQCGTISGLRVAIVGDIRHSRVARSQVELLKRMGADIAVCAPTEFMPHASDEVLRDVSQVATVDEALDWCSVLSLLRIQHERIGGDAVPAVDSYRARYAYTVARAQRFPNCLVLHPGPVNAGIEIDADTLHLPHVLIHRQVTHGVAIRMAVLRWVLST